MRKLYPVLAALTLAGCAAEDTERPPVAQPAPVGPVAPVTPAPTPPYPQPRANFPAMLWVMVIEPTGECIDRATVQVISGQRVGPAVVQDAECDAWSYGGGVLFMDLTPEVAMAIRATAPDGRVEEKTVMPTVGWYEATTFKPR
jgi:hypothetical protein